ncbi:hypothetical protein AAG570_013092 [Ranatra chinensis]|uniref:Uncharacterized protein n=1 Tax=Ranatra chinensis TaxID=642074 RepID=A0ABD0Z418_9HEMI
MKLTAGNLMTDDVVRTLWLQGLPKRMQEILSIRADSTDDEQLASAADKIAEVNDCSTLPQAAQPSSSLMPVTPAIENLLVDLLTKLLTRMESQERQDQRRRPSNRSWRPTSRSPSASKQTDGRCFYHRKFGADTRKCLLPCTFKAPEN